MAARASGARSGKVRKLLLVPLALLAGCATAPSGPSVLVLPGTGKSFDQFRADEQECRQYAQAQSGGAAGDGALAGSGAAGTSSYALQKRYDFAYQQCMYAKGHKVPMSRAEAERYRPPPSKAAPPPPPPPPAGTPPGVPPDYKPS